MGRCTFETTRSPLFNRTAGSPDFPSEPGAPFGQITISSAPNPPAASDPDTISRRTALYFLMLAISVVAAIGACLAQRSLKARVGTWNATISAVAGFVALIALVEVALPNSSEIPSGFPASTLWQFRIVALGGQFILWVVIGLAFGLHTDWSVRRRLRAV